MGRQLENVSVNSCLFISENYFVLERGISGVWIINSLYGWNRTVTAFGYIRYHEMLININKYYQKS